MYSNVKKFAIENIFFLQLKKGNFVKNKMWEDCWESSYFSLHRIYIRMENGKWKMENFPKIREFLFQNTHQHIGILDEREIRIL